MIIVNRVSTKTYQADATTGAATAQKSTSSAAHVRVAATDVPDAALSTLDEEIYALTTGDGSLLSSYSDYTKHSWLVTGVDADDHVEIRISLDGVNLYALALVRLGDTTLAPVTSIVTPGLYVPAVRCDFAFMEQKVFRTSAVGSNAVVVRYMGRL